MPYRELQLAEDELMELERKLGTMSLERCVKVGFHFMRCRMT